MRIWSIHPKYLDSKGIVALWREALLAKKVLQGKTKGYTKHPQLQRFKESKEPLKAINTYLFFVWIEANKRGYSFDRSKCKYYKLKQKITVTYGQIKHEEKHLGKKLFLRDKKKFSEFNKISEVELNPIFYRTKGPIEEWEKK